MKISVLVRLVYISTIASLLANVEINQGFARDYPFLFLGAQMIMLLFFSLTARSFIRQKNNESETAKYDLIKSVIICCFIYVLAYLSKYAFTLILAIGVLVIYFLKNLRL